jgi:DMSO/TMAO reductase YedYZ molybdopterin-dependent catalytic subunit
VRRRSFLVTLLRAWPAVAVAGFLPSVALAQRGVPKDRLIVRSPRPEDLETPVHLLTSWITPNELFYVRSHFYTPSIELSEWRLRVDGEVERPLDLTLEDVRSLPATTQVVTIECAGNGRAFFSPRVAGVQWERGAVGTAAWTGVRLADLLGRAAIKPSARYVWLDGADRGVGRAPDFIRSLPIDKALDRDTLLAYDMNGETLPIQHGYPLRAVVPGWEGAYAVKWLTHIQVRGVEHDGPFVQTAYRYPRRPVAPGGAAPAADMLPLRNMPVKSIITTPATNSAAERGSPVRISGFAWAGEAEIRRVDVSTDSGRTWSAAQLGSDRSRHAWRQFEHVWRPGAGGSYLVLARATDSRGATQPVVPDWNPAGYIWNAIDSVRINVEA